jgi:hypothetical protein
MPLTLVVSNPNPRIPMPGDEIYVPAERRVLPDLPDRIGGKAQVYKVELVPFFGQDMLCVTVREHPGVSYQWDGLALKQSRLCWDFRDQRAGLDYDFHQEFDENVSAQ